MPFFADSESGLHVNGRTYNRDEPIDAAPEVLAAYLAAGLVYGGDAPRRRVEPEADRKATDADRAKRR